MIASWCAASRRTTGPGAALSFPIPPRRSRNRAKSSPGPGAPDEKGHVQPLDVRAGDRVLFGKWSGTEVKLDGEELLIMKESDILGVLEGVAAKKQKAA
jgi:hypothetical protein